MDRTLVRAHTARLYTRYRRARGEVGVGYSVRVGWWLLCYSLGLVDAPSVARRALAEYAGASEAEHAESCRRWFPEYVLPHVTPEGRRAVARHRAAGERVLLVTGATRYIAGPLAEELGIEDLVCSEVEVDPQGTFTGRVHEPLCFAEGKLERARRALRERGERLEDATFYSDSITDLPLLAAVGEPVAVNPDLRLRRVAEQRGWRVERW
jgi:HAD superfamily hydrolase (TIGR01490 family)